MKKFYNINIGTNIFKYCKKGIINLKINIFIYNLLKLISICIFNLIII